MSRSPNLDLERRLFSFVLHNYSIYFQMHRWKNDDHFYCAKHFYLLNNLYFIVKKKCIVDDQNKFVMLLNINMAKNKWLKYIICVFWVFFFFCKLVCKKMQQIEIRFLRFKLVSMVSLSILWWERTEDDSVISDEGVLTDLEPFPLDTSKENARGDHGTIVRNYCHHGTCRQGKSITE